MKKKKLFIGLVALLVLTAFIFAQYHVIHRSNRYWKNDGTFSTDGQIRSVGVDNGLRLAYSGGRYIDLAANDDGELEFEVGITRATEGYSTMQFWTGWSNADENRKGVINIFASRDAEYICTSPGGSPDMGMQIYVRNDALNVPVGVGNAMHNLRAFEAIAANGPKSNAARTDQLIAGYFSTENRSGCTSTNMRTIQANYDQSGNANTDHTGVYVLCNSQSNIGTNYGVQITTAAWNQVREYALFIDSNGGSWTNAISFNGTITSALDFEGTDGTSAAYYEAGMTDTGATGADLDGWIRVTIDGNVLYIYCYADIPT